MLTKSHIIKLVILFISFSSFFGCKKDYPIIKDVIPNAGFEIWAIEYDSLRPSCWNGGTNTISRTNNAYSGNYAVVIESAAFSINGTSSGVLTSFEFDCSNSNYFYGFSIRSRPKSLNGFFKYLPVDNDSCRLYIVLYHQTRPFGSKIIVAQGILVEGRTIENYTEFRLRLKYDSDIIPNRASIMFVSSHTDVHRGSKIVIDELKFKYN